MLRQDNFYENVMASYTIPDGVVELHYVPYNCVVLVLPSSLLMLNVQLRIDCLIVAKDIFQIRRLFRQELFFKYIPDERFNYVVRIKIIKEGMTFCLNVDFMNKQLADDFNNQRIDYIIKRFYH